MGFASFLNRTTEHLQVNFPDMRVVPSVSSVATEAPGASIRLNPFN